MRARSARAEHRESGDRQDEGTQRDHRNYRACPQNLADGIIRTSHLEVALETANKKPAPTISRMPSGIRSCRFDADCSTVAAVTRGNSWGKSGLFLARKRRRLARAIANTSVRRL